MAGDEAAIAVLEAVLVVRVYFVRASRGAAVHGGRQHSARRHVLLGKGGGGTKQSAIIEKQVIFKINRINQKPTVATKGGFSEGRGNCRSSAAAKTNIAEQD